MVGQFLSRRARGLAALVLWCSLSAVTGFGADTPDTDEDEPPPDINIIRMKADAGHVQSQAMLADFLAGTSDFTNAVIWYRKAAEQGNVGAQLSLASLLVTGRGTARNPQEAAKWLRLAANGIESVKPVGQTGSAPAATPTNPPPVPPAPIVITKASVAAATNTTGVVTKSSSPAVRVDRLSVLLAPEPVLQEIRPVLRPPPDPQ